MTIDTLNPCDAPLHPQAVHGLRLFNAGKYFEAHEALERLEAAFRQLPDDYREVILLARMVGLSHAEIGRQMERTPQAVRVMLHRALARLARLTRLPGR